MRYGRRRARVPSGKLWGVVAGVALLAACDAVSTDVDNPNVVVQDDIRRPDAAEALVNGVLFQLTDAVGQIAAAHSTISDEATWRGSFDGVGALDRGDLGQPDQRYTSDGYEALTVGRWLGDETIEILEEQRASGELQDLRFLADAYRLAGTMYVVAAENFEEFAISDRREPGPVVARDVLFDTGIENLNTAVGLAAEAGDSDLELEARAFLARAHWARAAWEKLTGGVPAQPLINNTTANNLAREVLAAVDPTWESRVTYSPTTLENRLGFELNSRREITVEDQIIEQGPSLRQSCWPGNSACERDGIRVMDPIDDIQDPALRREAWGFFDRFIYGWTTLSSARELNLILAEAALAQGDVDDFATYLNAVRALEPTLTPYDPGVHTEIDPTELLVHSRRVNLFFQSPRRLIDMYRFDITAPVWASNADAVRNPGQMFPLSDLECDSNELVGPC